MWLLRPVRDAPFCWLTVGSDCSRKGRVQLWQRRLPAGDKSSLSPPHLHQLWAINYFDRGVLFSLSLRNIEKYFTFTSRYWLIFKSGQQGKHRDIKYILCHGRRGVVSNDNLAVGLEFKPWMIPEERFNDLTSLTFLIGTSWIMINNLFTEKLLKNYPARLKVSVASHNWNSVHLCTI